MNEILEKISRVLDIDFTKYDTYTIDKLGYELGQEYVHLEEGETLNKMLEDEYDRGHADGYDEGVEETTDTAYNQGYNDGYDAGYKTGDEDARLDCEYEHDVVWSEGYDEGWSDGYDHCLSDVEDQNSEKHEEDE